MGAVNSQISIPTTVKLINSEPPVRTSKCLPKTHLYTNAWRLIDSEFNTLNALFSFTVEVFCDSDGTNRHGSLPFHSEKDSFLSHDIAGQFVYCNPP